MANNFHTIPFRCIGIPLKSRKYDVTGISEFLGNMFSSYHRMNIRVYGPQISKKLGIQLSKITDLLLTNSEMLNIYRDMNELFIQEQLFPKEPCSNLEDRYDGLKNFASNFMAVAEISLVLLRTMDVMDAKSSKEKIIVEYLNSRLNLLKEYERIIEELEPIQVQQNIQLQAIILGQDLKFQLGELVERLKLIRFIREPQIFENDEILGGKPMLMELCRSERIFYILETEQSFDEHKVSTNVKRVIQSSDLNRYLLEFI